MEHQPTLRAMVEAMIGNVRHLSDIFAMSLEDDGVTAIIHCDIVSTLAEPQMVEYSVAILYRVLSELCRGRWHPDAIHFTHPAPADLSDHRRILQCKTVFDSDYNGLECRSALLDIANPRADATLAKHAAQLLGLVTVGSGTASIVERTRQAIALLMPEGQADTEHVADHLGIRPRRLQRLLAKEDRSFTLMVNEVRRQLVVRHLGSPGHSIAAVSALAGYSNQSAFTRWFAQEFGMSPASWRSEPRAGAA
jgi:AraC-like DNA-binding protein